MRKPFKDIGEWPASGGVILAEGERAGQFIEELERCISLGEEVIKGLKAARKELDAMVLMVEEAIKKAEEEQEEKGEESGEAKREMEEIVRLKAALENARDRLAEGLDQLITSSEELLDILTSYRKDETKRNSLGRKVELQENDVFSTCLIILTRAEGLWYRRRTVGVPEPIGRMIEEAVAGAIRAISPWVANCIRWARVALPPTKPLHDVLMEVKASFADALLHALRIEEERPIAG